MKIAYLAPLMEPGGAERQMLYLARHLPRPEFDVRFILMAGRGVLADEAEKAGVQVHELGLGSVRSQGLVRRLPDLLQALRRYRTITMDVDIVDAWLVPSYTLAGLAKPLTRPPIVIAGRRSALGVDRTRTRGRELAGDLAMRSIDAVVANSQAAADEAILKEGIPSDKVQVIPNAVESIAADPSVRETLRRRWGFGDRDVIVGCVGTLQVGKGQELVLEIARMLRDKCPDLRYVLVGDGPLRPSLERQIQQFDLGAVVRLHGSEPDARGVYAGFDICLQASRSEGLPNVVLEAAAAGRAIVATDVGGTAEVISSEQDGILVQRDVAEMADAVARVADDAAFRDRLGSAASRRAQDFSIDRLVSRTADLYRTLARTSGRR